MGCLQRNSRHGDVPQRDTANTNYFGTVSRIVLRCSLYRTSYIQYVCRGYSEYLLIILYSRVYIILKSHVNRTTTSMYLLYGYAHLLSCSSYHSRQHVVSSHNGFCVRTWQLVNAAALHRIHVSPVASPRHCMSSTTTQASTSLMRPPVPYYMHPYHRFLSLINESCT